MSSEKMSVKMGEAFVHGWRLRASRQATGGTGIHDFVYVHLKIDARFIEWYRVGARMEFTSVFVHFRRPPN